MKVLIVGNSHTRMIRRALEIRQASGLSVADVDMEICWVKGGSESKHGDFTPGEILEKIAGLRETDLLVLTLLGTAHHIIGVLEHDIPFALLETTDGAVTPPAGAQIIPMRSMQAYFESVVQREGLVHQFRRAARCPVFHFSPGPPGRKDPSHRAAVRKQPERTYGSRHNLLALWKLEVTVVQTLMNNLHIGVIETPEGVLTSEGLLEDRFCANDLTHASAAYGELILQKIENLFV
jgi:hypothetical protein